MASLAQGDDTAKKGNDVREQDRFLPIANISRIMKKSLPPNAKIAKDAKETVQVRHERRETRDERRGRERQRVGE